MAAKKIIDASAYCLSCQKKYDVKDLSEYKLIKRKLKNGLTTTILCGVCPMTGNKICTILGNNKTPKKNYINKV